MAFIDIRFPTDISEGAVGGPMYNTIVTSALSGREQRTSMWGLGRMKYDIAYALKTPANMAVATAFFRNCRGRAHSFRYKDWADYKATMERFDNPYPGTFTYLQKNYSAGAFTEKRKITKPVEGTVVIYANEEILVEGLDYTLDYSTGAVQFTLPHLLSTAFYWTGQFDVHCRFDTDEMRVASPSVTQRTWDEIPIIEVRD